MRLIGKTFGKGGGYPVRVLTSHDVLHELAHYLIADETQREFPEFGLDWGIAVPSALGPLGSAYRTTEGVPTWTYEQAGCMRLVDPGEAILQEFFAQQFCVAFGSKYGVPSQMESNTESIFDTWSGYFAYKMAEVLLSKLAKDYLDDCPIDLWTKAERLVAAQNI